MMESDSFAMSNLRSPSQPSNGAPFAMKPGDCSQMTEAQFRDYLDRTFEATFKPYEKAGGRPCQEVLKLFQYRDFGIPKERRDELILKMDSNRDGRINYREFKKCLVNTRLQDLSKWDRFCILTLLSGNPGLRLRAAKEAMRKHVGQQITHSFKYSPSQQIDSVDARLQSANPLRGGYELPGGKFSLEPDGVWPTSRAKKGLGPHDVWDKDGPRVTIKDEQYIPESYLNAYNCIPPPFFIPLIVLIQIIIFIAYAVQINQRLDTEPWNAVTWSSGWPYFSPLYYDPRRRRECWRYLTYMFLHSGIEHILFNSIMTLFVGIPIEWANKFWRVVPVYFGGVFLGCLGHSVLEPNIILLGSSGGVYALIGAHLALIVLNWEEMQHDYTYLRTSAKAFFSSAVVRLILILAFVLVDFSFALYRRYGLSEELTFSFLAHIFGFAAGLLLGIPILLNLRELPWERVLFWVCLAIYGALVVIGILFNIFYPGYVQQTV